MPDARCTRSRLCNKKHRRQQLQVHRNNRHSLRNGFNGVLRALFGDHRLVATVAPRIASAKLSACIGAPRPHDFTVRAMPFVRVLITHCGITASIASRSQRP